MPESAREKLAMFTHVDKDQVICLPDVNTIYKVPVLLYEHGLADWFAQRLSLHQVSERLSVDAEANASLSSSKRALCIMQKWIELAERYLYILCSYYWC